MLQRDTSRECSDGHGGNFNGDLITTFNIVGLQEDSRYSITVEATNGAGSRAVTVASMTLEAGERLLLDMSYK